MKQFRTKPYLAAILGLLAACSVPSHASRHAASAAGDNLPKPVQPPATLNAPPAALPAPGEAARHLVVEGIGVAIAGGNLFQLHVRTTSAVTPQAQVITGPDRLVIDVPGATPGRALRNQTVNQGQVERVRVGLFSATPQVTRIVLDLKSPTAYQIQTNPSGFTVTLGADIPASQPASGAGTPANQPMNGANIPASQPTSGAGTPASQPANDDRPTIGWVTSGSAAASAAPSPSRFVISNPAPVPVSPSGVRVVGGSGKLEIHAHNATLSEVLSQIKQQTGAEIAIPPGTEQQRVIGDFGPGTASEVLAQLLNGSDLNFVVVGTPNNPYALRSVILTHKAPGGPDPPQPDNTPSAPAYDYRRHLEGLLQGVQQQQQREMMQHQQPQQQPQIMQQPQILPQPEIVQPPQQPEVAQPLTPEVVQHQQEMLQQQQEILQQQQQQLQQLQQQQQEQQQQQQQEQQPQAPPPPQGDQAPVVN